MYIIRAARSAKHSVKGGLAFLWEMRFLTPYSSAPNEPTKMPFGTRDYVMEARPLQIFITRLILVYPRERVKYTDNVCPFFCPFFDRHAPRLPWSAIFLINAHMTSFRASCAFGVGILNNWN